MTPKIYCLPSLIHMKGVAINSYEGGHCDPFNKKLRENPGSMPLATLIYQIIVHKQG